MSKGGFYKGMEQLRSYGIDFEKGDYDNRVGLHLAAKEGQLDCVKFLIKQCKNVNIEDKFGRTPLFEAVINRYIINSFNYTNLYFRNKEVVIELNRAGGVVKAPVRELTSILMEAIRKGD